MAQVGLLSAIDPAKTISASAAVIAVLIAVLLNRRDSRRSREQFLELLWSQILDIAREHPELCDLSITDRYLARMDWKGRLAYDAICLQAWSTLHEAAGRKLLRGARMSLAMEWMAAFHSRWLINNAHLFSNEAFWSAFAEIEGREPRVIRHRPVPSDEGEITWDTLTEQYFDMVLSPFDPTVPRDNPIATTLGEMESTVADPEQPLRVLDLGCGPAHILEYLERLPFASRISYTGIDKSLNACRQARARAALSTIPCVILHEDVTVSKQRDADIVVAINLVLTDSRKNNLALMEAIASALASRRSRAILLLPAYEVIDHVASLRRQWYSKHASPKQAQRAVDALRRLKRPHPTSATYSDDGVNRQAFHSLTTIAEELPKCRLSVTHGPEKFYYPWELTRRFDYGFFPGEEKTWDWFLVCTTEEHL